MKRTIIFIITALAIMECKAQSVLMPEMESAVMNEKREAVETQARFVSTEQYADLCIKYHVKKNTEARPRRYGHHHDQTQISCFQHRAQLQQKNGKRKV